MSTCFVIMPFGGYFDGYYQKVIKSAVSRTGMAPLRADEIYTTGSIVDDIYRKISESRVCIADVTGRNPNVSYELGMAHALNKPVLMITQDIKDVPFDYRHLRIVVYDPMSFGWEDTFSRAVETTIREVLKDPTPHLALKPQKTPYDFLKSHLTKIFFELDCVLEKIDDMYYKDDGHTLIETEWTFTANSPVFHFCHNLVSEKPGNIEVLEAHDVLSGRDLDIVCLERGEKHLSYMVLLQQFKKPGQNFVVRTKAYAEYYLFGLEPTGSVNMSHQAAQRSGIHYSKKVERYHFPYRAPFQNANATYRSHPQSQMVGGKVFSQDRGSSYLLELSYDAKLPYRQETGATISLK